MAVSITREFRSSYRKLHRYPENLQSDDYYPSILKGFRKRLDDADANLFGSADSAEVPIRELDATGVATHTYNIWDDAKLRSRLGDTSTSDAQGHITSGAYATKPDPRCRFIFLRAKTHRSPLKITREMLSRILTYHQVTPRYLELLLLFGQQLKPLDLRHGSFREETSWPLAPGESAMPSLERSGCRYQLCFNLKTVNCDSDVNASLSQQDWQIRQAAIYHSLDFKYGNVLWIVAKADDDLQTRCQEATGADARPRDKSFATPSECFRSSCAIISLLANWASEDWRWYIQWLDKVIDQQTYIDLVGNRASSHRKNYTAEDLQSEHQWEERANEAVMIIKGNVTVLNAIRLYYEDPALASCFHENISKDVTRLSAQINDAIADLNTQRSRAQLLADIISHRKALYLQAQASEKMEELAYSSQRETIAMRVITIITLVYLPATFVSVSRFLTSALSQRLSDKTFFSTDIVKYQNDNGPSNNSNSSGDNDLAQSTSYSALAMNRWLQVTLPLTFVTALLAWVFYSRARKGIPRRAGAFILPTSEPKV